MAFLSGIEQVFAQYFSIAGRTSREVGFAFVSFTVLGFVFFALIDALIFGASLGIAPFCVVFAVIIFVPTISLAFRRLHDTNKSGWWLLLVAVPGVGWLVLLYFFLQNGTEGENRFGPEPRRAEAHVFVAAPAE